MSRLEGIIPPLPTAFDHHQELFPEKIRQNIKSLLQFDLSGILVLGSNGELVMLSEQEREQVYAIARESIPGDRLLVAGCGGQSTMETLKLVRLAGKHGADAALVLNPFYYRNQMTDQALARHYQRVADASPIPIIIYNMPANTGIDMGAELMLNISSHPNIIGFKDSGNDIEKMHRILQESKADFRLMIGSANNLYPALEIGASGGFLAFANIRPQTCLDLLERYRNGDTETAAGMQQSIIALNTAITRRWGVPALKAAMDNSGLYGGPARDPLLPLDKEKQAGLLKLLADSAAR